MHDFSFFIQDARYSVPSLLISAQPDANRAKQLARQLLYNSPHHLAVEICLDDAVVASLQRQSGAGGDDEGRAPDA